MARKLAVVAIGGNSLIKDKFHQTVRDQYVAAKETCDHLVSMVKEGWRLAVVHGNGPQVGFIMRRSELAAHELHDVPMDACVADTQGALGYALQQNFQNEFRRFGVSASAVTVVSQVEVDADDPAFKKPSKPIGSFMDEAKARERAAKDGWDIAEDAGRGWRRVVASPRPKRIVEEEAIKRLLESDFVVVCAGGGGIPVRVDSGGQLEGVAAVIDKDLAASLLATRLGADLFVISTAVEKVAINFGKPDQKWLDRLSLAEAKAYLAEGKHFAAGSMAPKIQAVIEFLENGGKEALITNPESLERAMAGETGTRITR